MLGLSVRYDVCVDSDGLFGMGWDRCVEGRLIFFFVPCKIVT